MFGDLIHKIRNGLDDFGAFVTGQPAHGPSPIPQQSFQPPQPQIQQPPRLTPPTINPAINPTINTNPVQQIQPNLITRAWDQVNPFDSGRTWQNPAGIANPYPNVPQSIQQQIQSGTHFNPQQKTDVLTSLNKPAPTFNPVSATAGSFGTAAKQVGGQLANGFGLGAAKDTADLAAGWLTHNDTATNNAAVNLSTSLPQFFPVVGAEAFKNGFGQQVATAITAPYASHVADQQAQYAEHMLHNDNATPAYNASVDAYANSVRGNLLNQHLNTAGVDMNTPTSTIVRRTTGNAANTLANMIMFGTLPNALEGTLASGAGRTALTFGGLNAAANIGATAGSANPSPLDYVKSGAMGLAQGTALPLLMGGGAEGARQTLDLAHNLGLKPPTDLSPDELTSASKVVKQNGGFGDQALTQGDMQNFHNAQLKLGAQPGTPQGVEAVQNALLAHQTFETHLAQRLQALQDFKAAHSGQEGFVKPFDGLGDGSQGEIDDFTNSYANEHNPQEIAQEHADMMRAIDQSAKGGQMVENNSEPGAPTYTRISEHSPFYRQYFADNKRAPSKAAYLEQATKELEAGKGNTLDPDMAQAYQLAKQRDTDNAAWIAQPNPEIARQSYYYGPNKNEGAFSQADFAALFGAPDRTKLTGAALSMPNAKLNHVLTEADVERLMQRNPMLPENAVSAEEPQAPLRSADLDREAQNILRNGGTPDDAAVPYQQAGKDYGDALREVSRVAHESNIYLGEKDASQNPLFNQVNLPEAKDWKQAVLNSDAVTKNIADLHNNIMAQAKGLSDHDMQLLDHTRNEPVEQLAKEAHNPDQFIRVAAAAKNLNDYTQEVGRMTGQNVAYRPSYGARMFYDLTDPASAKAYEAYKASLKQNPGYGKHRAISSYDEAAGLGIKRAHANYIEDLMHDAVSRGNDLSKLTLAKGLKEAYPDQVKVGEIGKTPEGTYEQLRIPHGQDLSLPKDIARDINARAQYEYQSGGMGRILRGYDSLNGATKFFKLSLGGFHNAVELSAFTARALRHGDFVGIAKNIDTIFNKGAFDKEMGKFQSDGSLEKAHFVGLTLNSENITADAGGKIRLIEKTPVIKQFHDALFQRQIPYAKMRIFADETKNLDLKNPSDVAKMRSTARALNDAFGGINRTVDGITPIQAKYFSRAVLALDYNEGQARSLLNAITKGGPAGKIARQVVVGRMALLAAPGIVQWTVTHPNDRDKPAEMIKQIFTQVLDPHVTSGFKTPSGIPKEIELPVNFGGKLERAASPFFDPNQPDKFSGIKSELSGNMASGPSSAIQLATNKDYFGNPIITRDPTTGKIQLSQSASNVAGQFEPISGGQVQKVITGQESPTEAAVNIIGGRTKANPDDPRVQVLNNRSKVFNGLNQQDQDALLSVHPSWGNLTKDQQNTVYTNPHYEEQKWDAMLSNQNVFNALKNQDAFSAAHGQPANPLFALNPTDAQTVMTYEWLKHADPGSGANNSAAVIYNQNTQLIQKFEQAYSNYGQQMNNLYQQTSGLQGSSAPALQIGGTPQYHPDQTTQNIVNQYYGLTDPKQRVQFMNDHPELNNYFEAQFQAENQVRASLHEPLLKDYPQADQPTQNFISQYMVADKATRKGLRSANPNLYNNMQSYLEQVDAYNVAKYAGQAQFQGQDFNQKTLKGIYGLGTYDMTKNPDGTYALKGTAGAQPGAVALGKAATNGGSSKGGTNHNAAIARRLRSAGYVKTAHIPRAPFVKSAKVKTKDIKPHAGFRIVPEGKFTGVTTKRGIKNIKSVAKGTGIKSYKVV